ncbi:MAG: HNH endonuclease [Euryarchaeota archaeon]|nr:HNH endonuclease [Euryarchaeota archaeon]
MDDEDTMTFSDRTRETARRKSKNTCCICHKAKVQRFHHIHPRSGGIDDKLSNCAPICGTCHIFIHEWGGLNPDMVIANRDTWYNFVKFIESDAFTSSEAYKNDVTDKPYSDGEKNNMKKIKDWLFFQTVWYKDILRGDYQYDDWRTSEEISNCVKLTPKLTPKEVSELCWKIDALEKDTKNTITDKWRIIKSFKDKFDDVEVFEYR